MQIISPLTYPDWDNLLLAAPGSSIFHTSYWARVLHDSYGYQPCYLTNINNGKMDVLVPMMEVKSLLTGSRGVSLPFTDYCEPIISNQNDMQDALEQLKDYGKKAKWKYLELRGGKEWFGQTPHSSFFYRHVMKLSADIDVMYGQLKSSTRRNIKKALREGVAITRGNSLDAVKSFYHLHCMTRKKHGIPPQPFQFFQKIYEHVISIDHGQVILAAHNGKTIAGAIYFHFGNEAIYKFGASESAYLSLRPNDLIMWETIQWYCRNGCTRFSFGRTESENEGLRQFKNGWGAEEKTIKYFKYDFKKRAFMIGSAHVADYRNNILRKMPIPLLKVAGSLLYKHMG